MSPWQELGIAPTAEAGAIRKAYAARLKRTRPDEDPAGFARLRAAYEAALQMAPRIAAAPPEPEPPRPEAPKPAPVPSQIIVPPRVEQPDPTPLELPPAAQAALRNIIDALNRKANFEAARLLYAACEGHLLPLRTEFQLKDRLALALAIDEDLRTDQLQEIAGRFGWYGNTVTPSTQANSPQARLAARIDREITLARRPLPPPAPPQRDSGSGRGWIWAVVVVCILVARLIAFIPPNAYSNHSTAGYGYIPPAPTEFQPLRPRIDPLSPLAPPSSVPDNASYWRINTPYLPKTSQAVPREPPCRLDKDVPPPSISLAQAAIFDARGRYAASGAAWAQNELGQAYLDGKEVPQDYDLAIAWFRLAASRGSPEARNRLAEMCRAGLGTEPDGAAARMLHRDGADAHDPSSQLGLGTMLITGEGGDADPAAGFALIRSAARASLLPAMAQLGPLYADGTGTRRDPAKALAWTKAAAAAGSPAAMQAYARMLEKNSSKADAYRWQALALRFGAASPEDDAALARLAAALTPKQRVALDKEVAAWRAVAPVPPASDAFP